MKKYYLISIVFAFFSLTKVNSQWQSELIKISNNGELEYLEDEDGFTLPDFSFAGYKYGELLPDVPVVKEISAIFGDNTQHIQDAINEVEAMSPDANGFRGALLLKAGTYNINGSLEIAESGIVLRGEGQGSDASENTLIIAQGDTPHQRTVITLGNNESYSWDSDPNNTKQFILNDTIPVGSTAFTVEDASMYSKGDKIIIYHPCSQNWLEKVLEGETATDPGWEVDELPILFYREIISLTENNIEIDAPVFYPLIKSISECYIYQPEEKMLHSIGIENLRVEIESEGGEDEDHAWDAIRFNLVENGWAKNCTAVGFGQAGFVTQYSNKLTIDSCSAIDPVAIIDGERMYNFNFYHGSQLILIKNSYTRNGRHHYISNGTTSVSGCVVYNCTSDAAYSAIEGHRKWTTGLLFDNLNEVNPRSSGRLSFAFYNRGDKGTAHGWSAAHCVAWNCDFGDSRACIQKPPSAQNYAIGCHAKRIVGDEVDFPMAEGFIEGTNMDGLEPSSLYRAQLEERGIIISQNISQAIRQSVNIYPNPTRNHISISAENMNEVTNIQIYNIAGSIELEFNNYIPDNTLDLSVLNSGIYLVKMNSNGHSHCKKLIINK